MPKRFEFGTFTGMSALAFLEGMSGGGKLFTVDVTPHARIKGSWLKPEDFQGGAVSQVCADMASQEFWHDYRDSVASADIILVDGPKDGMTEPAFFLQMERMKFRKAPIVVVDDIRFLNMLSLWRSIRHPKMDFTSYGHWSGTGLIDWASC